MNNQSPEYQSYVAMKTRCFNPNAKHYNHYGGRGIDVCPEWCGKGGFTRFLKDMGPRPTGTSLNRTNNDDNYEPENCEWATQTEQMRNQRTRKDNTSGHKGIYWDSILKKWRAGIGVNNKMVWLGVYKSKSEAIKIRQQAEVKYF